MAVIFHGFSIRDYTSNTRSVDVFKSWPFAVGELTREEVEAWLPPMTVPKSRWWSDELAVLRSNRSGEEESENLPEEVSGSDDGSESAKSGRSFAVAASEEKEKKLLEMICPVCREFNAATLTAVNAHMDGCLARTMKEERRQMRRSKSKAPKKRSIAEIFELEEDEEEPQQQHKQIETVLKLWPFGENADEVSMTVTKFRWLSRRLKALRSNGESVESDDGNSNSAGEEEKLEMVCPVCRVFNAATVTAVNAHIDGCLALAMREERLRMRRPSSNPKPKAPKKRSLAEILTVAPQIDAGELVSEAEEEDEDGVDGETFQKSGCSGATIKRKKSTNKKITEKKKTEKKSKVDKRGVVPLNNESRKMKRRKKKKMMMMKKKNLLNKEFTAKKEDASKRKVQNPVNSSKKLKGTTGNKTVKLDDQFDTSAHENKLGMKILSEETKEKLKNCDSVGKQQKAVSPIRGILKNHKHISESTSSCCNIQEDTEESHCDVQMPSSDRHVRFSAEDYVLCPKKRNSFDETVFNLSSDVPASFEKGQSSGSDEGTANLEANRNDDDLAINMDKRKEVCPMVENKQFSNAPGQVAAQNFLKPCANQEKSKHLVEKSESLPKVAFCDNNSHGSDRGNTTTLHFPPYSDVSRPLSAFQAVQVSDINTRVCESEAFSSAGRFIDHLEDPAFQSSAVNSNANTRTYLEPSSSYSASYNKGNERAEFPLHAYGDNANNGQTLGGRLCSDIFSADMVDKSFLLPGWGKGSVRNNCMEQNFFGLPLNSHGELINVSSSGKVGMNQPETSCALRGSFSGLPVNNTLHQNSQEYLSIGERRAVQMTIQDRVNPLPHFPASRLGVADLHRRERADIYQHNSDRCSNHYVQPLDSDLNLLRNSFVEQNKHDKMPNHKGYGMIPPKESSGLISPSSSQPTMRLMGKDVPIGKSSKEKQQFVGGDLWVDEESRRSHYSEDAAKDKTLLGRCFNKQDRVSGSQLQMSTENVLQPVRFQGNQALQSTLLMKGPNSEFHNLQSNISQNGSLGVSRNARSNVHHFNQAPSSSAIYQRSHGDLPEQFIARANPQGLSFQSQVLPNPCNFRQPTLSNGELNDRKKHHHVTNSAFGFPFPQSVVEEQAKTSSFKRSYISLPPWLSGPTHERLLGTSSSNSFPQNTWGHNFTTPSVNHSAEALYPPNSVTSHCPRKASLCPASIFHSPPVTKPPSAINSGCRNIIKVTDRVKFDDMTTKGHHHPCTNSRKRPAANLDDLTKSNKLPTIKVQENLSRMTGLARKTSSANLQLNTRTVGLDPRVGAISNCCQNEARNLIPRSCLGFDSFDLDGVGISGPVKLSPGANHMLKPSQNVDQDNSRPIHSVTPIAAITDSDRDLELQRKLTKMHRF